MNEQQLLKLFEKTQRDIQQVVANQKKTDAQLARTDAQLTRTDAQLARTDARMEKGFEKVEKELELVGKKIAEVAKLNKELSEMYGGVSENLGDEAELEFYAALSEKPFLADIKFDEVMFDLHRQKNANNKVQIDVFLLNGDSMAVVEVKRKLQSAHIDKLHDQTIPKFLALYPEYKNKKLYAVLATYGIPKKAKAHVKKRLHKYGYGLITPDRSGTSLDIDTSDMRVIN